MAPQPLHFEREHGEKDQNIDKGNNYEESDPKKGKQSSIRKATKREEEEEYLRDTLGCTFDRLNWLSVLNFPLFYHVNIATSELKTVM